MREVVDDIWDFPCTMRVIPTNLFVKNNGMAVMGAGLAKQAMTMYPNLPRVLGTCIRTNGTGIHVIRHDLIAFPTKHVWWENSDLELIARSAMELRELTLKLGWKLVALPRVGCGNGQLRWGVVKPILEDAFGDDPHFVIVDNG